MPLCAILVERYCEWTGTMELHHAFAFIQVQAGLSLPSKVLAHIASEVPQPSIALLRHENFLKFLKAGLTIAMKSHRVKKVIDSQSFFPKYSCAGKGINPFQELLCTDHKNGWAWIRIFTYATLRWFNGKLLNFNTLHECLFTWNNLPDKTIQRCCLLPVPFESNYCFVFR